MRTGKTIILYEACGRAISAQEVFVTGDNLADWLVSLDGRKIHCEDESGVFFYDDDQQSKLYLTPRSQQS